MHAQQQHTLTSRKWLWASIVLLALLPISLVIFLTGALLNPIIWLEQWLLHRPLSGTDCTLRLWATAGDVPFSLFLMLVLGAVCWRLNYGRRVFLYLLILLLFSVGIELAGKQFFPQPLPQRVDVGLNALDCPQIDSQPVSRKALILLGAWWIAPPAGQDAIQQAQQGATPVFDPRTEALVPTDNSLPSGHAIRWSFLGFIAFWLAWKHMRRGKLRAFRYVVMAVALIFAFGGGFAQFYVGAHLASDIIAGYFVGFGLACLAIYLLSRTRSMRERTHQTAASENGPQVAVQSTQNITTTK